MERVLITGGAGLLALNWAIAIRDKYSVTLGLHDRHVALKNVHTCDLVLDSVDMLQRQIYELQPDVVIHAAGLTSIEMCERNPVLARFVNVQLAGNVALACAKSGVRLVHVSTDHLFNGEQAWMDESAPISPLNVYATTKANAEMEVLDKLPQTLVIRTNFYGFGTSYRYSFSDFIINSLRRSDKITLFQDVFYTPIIITDLSIAVHELLQKNVAGIFHVVGDDRLSKYEFGIRLAEKFHLDKGRILPGRMSNQISSVRRPFDMSLSNKKLQHVLGRAIGSTDGHLDALLNQQLMQTHTELETL